METLQLSLFFIIIAVVVLILIVLLPVLSYLLNGWNLRKREILSSFSGDGILRYYETFYQTEFEKLKKDEEFEVKKLKKEIEARFKEETTENKKDNNSKLNHEKENLKKEGMKKIRENQNEMLIKKFGIYYQGTFGQKRFWLPLSMLMLVIVTILFLLLLLLFPVKGLELSISSENYKPFILTCLAGFFGAYMWILQFLFRRIQGRQLSPADLNWASFRIFISIPISLALTSFFGKDFPNEGIAFMLGAFPTTTLLRLMRTLVTAKLGTKEDIEETSNVMNLQGIGRNQEERYSEEGVENVLQLAYSDPVDLTIRTGYSFSYVVDCCSQALAWLCLEKSMESLRKYGIRGAQEIITFVNEINRDASSHKETQDEEQKWANKTLEVMALELKMDIDALRRTFDEIAFDPYAQLLNDLWQSDWNLKTKT